MPERDSPWWKLPVIPVSMSLSDLLISAKNPLSAPVYSATFPAHRRLGWDWLVQGALPWCAQPAAH